MNLKGNTVLITGGSMGIGFELAKAFLDNGSEVIICGRREDRLKEAKEKLPALKFKVCDVADRDQRRMLDKEEIYFGQTENARTAPRSELERRLL